MSSSERRNTLKTSSETLVCLPASLPCGGDSHRAIAPTATSKDVFQPEIEHTAHQMRTFPMLVYSLPVALMLNL